MSDGSGSRSLLNSRLTEAAGDLAENPAPALGPTLKMGKKGRKPTNRKDSEISPTALAMRSNKALAIGLLLRQPTDCLFDRMRQKPPSWQPHHMTNVLRGRPFRRRHPFTET